MAASRAAAAPAGEAEECETDDDLGGLAGNQDDGEDEDTDEDATGDRCHRSAYQGAFDYLDDDTIEQRDARSLRDLEAAVLEELASDGDGDEPRVTAAENDVDEASAEHDLVASADALDADDVTAVYEQLLHDPDAVASLDASEAALVDDPLVRDAIETGSAFSSTSFADASELEDLALRHQRPSRWGRLDLTVAWRRAWTPHPVTISLGPLPHGPIAQSYDTADHVLVLATWSH